MIRLVLLIAAGAVATGCPGTGVKNESTEVGPPIPTDFAPPAPLGPEPPVPDALAGRGWLDATHERIYAAWSQGFLEQARVYLPPSHPLNSPTLAVTLELVLEADGRLRTVTVVTPSGNADFDAAARAVVTESAPYKAPPAELRSDDGFFYVSWLFARDDRQAGVAGAKFDRRQWAPERAVPALLAAGRWDDAARRLSEAMAAKPDAPADDTKGYLALAHALAVGLIDAGLAGSSENSTRIAAAHAAGRAKLVALAPALRGLARDAADPALRRAAIEALGRIGDQDALPLLAEVVSAFDGERSASAATAMAQLGARDKAWELCAAKLADADAEVRTAALATAANLGSPSSVSALAGRLADKSAPRGERALAARALGAVAAGGSSEAAKALGAALLDGDAAIRAAALAAFVRAGQGGYRSRGVFYKIEPLLKDRDAQVRAGAVLAAAAVEPTIAGGAIASACRKDKNRAVLEACATALGGVPGAESLKLLLKLSGSGEANVRGAALHALSTRAEPEARKAVEGFASSEDPALRLMALDGAGSAQVEVALGDPALEVRAVALERLVREGGVRFLPRFLELVLATQAPGERVRYAEAWLSATSS